MKQLLFFICHLLLVTSSQAQKILFVDSSQVGISFRGLSVVSDSVLWVSGSRGTVGKSVDGGHSFIWMHPTGFEKRDFRDVEAFDGNTALLMAVDSPAIILKTIDGGHTWKTVYEKHLKGIFLDAMTFKNNQRGICIGDPINLRFWLVETADGGDTWQEIPPPFRPQSVKDEALFASSGTNLQFTDDPKFEYGFVSGGYQSRLFMMPRARNQPGAVIELEINKELTSTGANSLAILGKTYMVVGGDFNEWKTELYNSTYSSNYGQSWGSPSTTMAGYKSCVAWKDDKNLIATGLSGTDISTKGPKAWQHISDIQFHVVQKAKTGRAIFLAGGNGRIGRYAE